MSLAVNLRVRPATTDDLPAIQRIYNDEILAGVATWDEEPWTMERRKAWFAEHDASQPVLVAECDGQVAGFACLTKMSQKSGWRFTREDTIYLAPEFRGRGIGRVLLTALIEEARRVGIHVVVASITTENEVSIHLHRSLGFEVVGTLREAGLKFGHRLDTCYLQLTLDN